MKCVRTHRSPLALLLMALVLLGAMACSIGHGQMLQMFSAAHAADICGPAGEAATAPAMAGDTHSAHTLVMQLALFDCVFASKLASALVFAIAAGWLLRLLSQRLLLPEHLPQLPGRHSSPGRAAQAP